MNVGSDIIPKENKLIEREAHLQQNKQMVSHLPFGMWEMVTSWCFVISRSTQMMNKLKNSAIRKVSPYLKPQVDSLNLHLI